MGEWWPRALAADGLWCWNIDRSCSPWDDVDAPKGGESSSIWKERPIPEGTRAGRRAASARWEIGRMAREKWGRQRGAAVPCRQLSKERDSRKEPSAER